MNVPYQSNLLILFSMILRSVVIPDTNVNVSKIILVVLFDYLETIMLFFRMYFLPTRLNPNKKIFKALLIICIVSLIYKNYLIKLQKKNWHVNVKPLKYVLIWTNSFDLALNYKMKANSMLVKGILSNNNCYFTYDRNFMDQTDFDAVVFSGVDVGDHSSWLFWRDLPSVRSPKQIYIFSTLESPHYVRLCSSIYDGFFNWTKTYRLDSDLIREYFNVYDLDDNIIGPSLNMKWLDRLDPIDEEMRIKLSNKSKTAMWFVSNCHTAGGREHFVGKLQEELKTYNRKVDIYGRCGTLSCPKDDTASCFKKLEEDYFFYLSFENAFAEDYVTEKLLTALNNYAVPVVYGGANYSRFVPPGSYLNALELGPKELARQMNEIIADPTKYHDFFRWRNHYQYRNDYSTEVRQLCEKLYDAEVSRMTVWNNFRAWWNGKWFKEICHLTK